MRTQRRRSASYFLVLCLIVLTAYGCAAVHDEQEGGISGTGNVIDCEEDTYKNDPLCRQP